MDYLKTIFKYIVRIRVKLSKVKLNKQMLGYVLAGLVLLVMLIVFASNSAYPGKMLYPIDLALEKAMGATKQNPQRQIEFHLGNAVERISELKTTKDSVDNSKIAATYFNENLDQLLEVFQALADQGQLNSDENVSLFLRVADKDLDNFVLTLSRFAKDKSYKNATKGINSMYAKIKSTKEAMLLLGVENIKDNAMFNEYAHSQVLRELRSVNLLIDNAVQDVGSILTKATPEEKTKMQSILDEAKRMSSEASKSISNNSQKEAHDKIQAISKYLGDNLGPMLVEISQRDEK